MPDTPNLKEAINQLQKAVEKTAVFFESLDPTNVPLLLDSYRAIHEQADLLDNLNKITQEIKRRLSYETIPAQFESMGIDSIKSKGRLYSIGVRLNASIPLDKRDAGYQWLRDNGLDSLITPTVNSKSLSSAVTKYIEANGLEPSEECMTVHKQTYTAIRKS